MSLNLRTSRLKLVPFAISDIDLLHDTFTDPIVREFLWDNEVVPLEQTREILIENEKHFSNDGWGLWKVINSSGEYTGFAGLWIFFDERQPQLLYGLLPAYHKKGFATEAAGAIIRYAFDELQFPFLIATCDAPHQRSVHVCLRLGMKKTADRVMRGKLISFFRIDNPAP